MNAYSVGGTVRTVANQANAMAAAGHDVEVVSVLRQRRTPAFGYHPRVRLRPLVDEISVPGRWLLGKDLHQPSELVPRQEVRYRRFNRLTDQRLVRYVSTLSPGILVTTRPALNLIAAEHAPSRVITVGQEHMHFDRHKPELARQIRKLYPRLDAVAVLTEADELAYRAALGDAVRVARIPNGLADIAPNISTQDRKLVVSAGRLVPNKGFADLINAFAEVVAVHPDWRLRIFGGGDEYANLRALIDSRDLYNHVFLMGTTEQLDDELAKASIFAMASRKEGFGMVLAEAMSHGVPPISYDCPHGPSEIIADGRDGRLIPVGDTDGLRDAINALIADPGRRREMAAAAVVSAHRYDAETIRKRWEELFAQLEGSGRAVALSGKDAPEQIDEVAGGVGGDDGDHQGARHDDRRPRPRRAGRRVPQRVHTADHGLVGEGQRAAALGVGRQQGRARQRPRGDVAVAGGSGGVFVRPALQQELHVPAQRDQQRVDGGGDVHQQPQPAVVVPQVGALVGQQHLALGGVQAAQHGRGDEDVPRPAGDGERPRLLGIRHDQLGVRRGAAGEGALQVAGVALGTHQHGHPQRHDHSQHNGRLCDDLRHRIGDAEVPRVCVGRDVRQVLVQGPGQQDQGPHEGRRRQQAGGHQDARRHGGRHPAGDQRADGPQQQRRHERDVDVNDHLSLPIQQIPECSFLVRSQA
ncbi:MAG TPA: glycosyltransferase family 4 protein [Stackebrandtia sp.]|jgi:glycosyltransferase involved in cell wall biosynthesis|nr:glycosyltransferase family 4 protein [Stackebrandtia sp.]HZE40210.1 glycosyltransferase family 4 protein [Stackebrandtia sp.]